MEGGKVWGVEWKDADLPSSQGSGSVSAVQRVITAPYVSRRYLSREARVRKGH